MQRHSVASTSNGKTFPAYACEMYKKIPSLVEFTAGVAKREKGLVDDRPFQDDHFDYLIRRARAGAEHINELKLAFTKRLTTRYRIRIDEELKRDRELGQLSGILKHLKIAYESGMLKEQSVYFSVLKDTARNGGGGGGGGGAKKATNKSKAQTTESVPSVPQKRARITKR